MVQKIRVMIDFETRSQIDLKKVGSVNYMQHWSTEVMCMAYKVQDQPTKLWKPNQEFPKQLLEILNNKDTIIAAHNALFEMGVIQYVLPRYGVTIDAPISRYKCTAAKAAACALPRSLGGVSEVLNLSTQKDKDGHKIMMKYSKPTTQWKAWKDWEEDGMAERRAPGKFHFNEAELWALYDYCMIDVETQALVDDTLPDLSPEEQLVWQSNIMMNFRGIKIDVETAKHIISLSEEYLSKLKQKVTAATRGEIKSVLQVQATLKWLKENGCHLSNLQAATVAAVLQDKTLSPKVRLVLEARQHFSKTSNKKYVSMIERAGEDERVRDLTMYHGASTGREAGRGLQVQNLPRGNVKNTDEAIEIIKSCDAIEDVEMFYTSPPDVFSSCIRGMITATEGHQLYVADFNAIECRVVNWLAGNEETILDFKEGRDPYKKLASKIFGVSMENVTDDQRFVGKQGELACIGEGTLVFTDKGLVPIEKITLHHRVWDGEGFVCHKGLLNKGLKETSKLCSVWLTENHQVLSGTVWEETGSILKDKNTLYQVLATGRGCLKSQVIFAMLKQKQLNLLLLNVIVVYLNTLLINITLKILSQLGVLVVEGKKVIKNSIGNIMVHFQIQNTEEDYLTDCLQQSDGATIKNQHNFLGMEKGGLKFLNCGVKIELNFLNIFKPLKGGITQNLKWTEQMLIKGMNLVTLGLFQKVKTLLIKEPSISYKKTTTTYDLLFSGSKNRFMIYTNQGPLIVHNCGYGVGHKKFIEMCAGFGRTISEKLGKRTIEIYRKSHKPVVDMWGKVERCAIQAVKNKGKKFSTNKTTWYCEDNFLWCVLPSKRRLAFYNPVVRNELTPWEELRPKLYYWKTNGVTRKWELSPTYGGSLVESVSQATARDITVNGVKNAEDAGFNYLFQVHDEIICEKLIGDTTIEDYVKLLVKNPDWCLDLPIKAGGWIGPRYKK